MPRCRAMTAAKERCKGKIAEGGLCWMHAKKQKNGEIIEDFYAEVKTPKESPTRPWDAADNPWKPDIFKTSKVHKGFRARFAAPEKVERKLSQGFQIADARDWVNEEELKKNEEGNIDTTLAREGMILMEIPEELAKQREAYYAHKTDLQDASKVKIREYQKTKAESEQSGHDMGLRMIE